MSETQHNQQGHPHPIHPHHHHHHHNSHAQFNPNALLDAFTKSIIKINEAESNTQREDILIKEYLIAYEEIVRFLELLGSVFYFVIIDIKEKITILENLMTKNSEDYSSLLAMVKHEKKSNFYVSQKDRQNYGVRTVLRLHRALIFVYKFLDQLVSAEQKAKSSEICTKVYEATLAKHHSWLVKKAAVFGMITLPRRDVLLGYMCKSPEDLEKFPDFIGKVENVYKITQEIYEKYQILDLP